MAFMSEAFNVQNRAVKWSKNLLFIHNMKLQPVTTHAETNESNLHIYLAFQF